MSAATSQNKQHAFVVELAAKLDTLDYYQVIGIEDGFARRVDYLRIREAHLGLVEIVHPDRYAVIGAPAHVIQSAAAIYKRIGEAITVIGDPLLRPLYDQERRRGKLRFDVSRAEDVLTAELRQIHHVFARYYTARALEYAASGDLEQARMMTRLGLGCQNVARLIQLQATF
jgi:curved DNA-binding protein CbpA